MTSNISPTIAHHGEKAEQIRVCLYRSANFLVAKSHHGIRTYYGAVAIAVRYSCTAVASSTPTCDMCAGAPSKEEEKFNTHAGGWKRR